MNQIHRSSDPEILIPAAAFFWERARTETTRLSPILLWAAAKTAGTAIFVQDEAGIKTEAFDPAKLQDPSLIIYAPVRVSGK